MHLLSFLLKNGKQQIYEKTAENFILSQLYARYRRYMSSWSSSSINISLLLIAHAGARQAVALFQTKVTSETVGVEGPHWEHDHINETRHGHQPHHHCCCSVETLCALRMVNVCTAYDTHSQLYTQTLNTTIGGFEQGIIVVEPICDPEVMKRF